MKWRWDFASGPVFRGLSRAAKGLYIDLIGLMRTGDSYGRLIFNGRPPSAVWLQRNLGDPAETLRALTKELIDAGMLARETDTNILYSPQMVNEEAAYTKGRADGALGGNPALKNPPKRRQRSRKVARKAPASGQAQAPLMAEKPITNQLVEGGLTTGLTLDLDLDRDSEKKGSPSEILVRQASQDDARRTCEDPRFDADPGTDVTTAANVVALPSRASEQIDRAVAMWNDLAERIDLRKCRIVSAPRRRQLLLRLKEAGGINGWAHALQQVEASEFLRGGGSSGWRADFDFMLQAKSFAKVMEGSYARMHSDQKESKYHFLTEMLADEVEYQGKHG
jgi:hypothetical protein